ncbi:unnamed protein product [Trichobilharzia szidati]|nr:unnamed protein product [Trichobilharzia szidati]CAH8834489.1 unnamed protein product [Trichobilharzia szidati]
MVVCKRDAHLALNQLSDYRNRLDSQKDGLLVEALNRLMNVFQSRLFLSLLDIQEFYEAILLDPQKTKEEKTSAALEIASRWENISSPSLVASTTDLRIPHSLMNKTNNFDRARSMYHINLDDSQNPRLPQPIQSSSPNYRRHLPPHDDDYHHHHHPHLSNLNKSWKHMEPDQQRFDYATSISLNNMNQPSSVENVSNVHLAKKHNNNNSHNSDFNPEHPLYTHDKPSQNEHEASKKQPPSTLPVAKPRQKRLKRLKSSQIHHLEEESISINTDENAYFNNNNNQFPVPQNNSQDNLLNDDDNELNDRQWALLSRLPVTMEVIIDKSPKGFGFSIAGGHDNTIGSNDDDTDIYVTRVNPGGPADYESGLQLGDRILSVNGISLIGATHSEAVKALQLAGNRLKLIVERKAELAISEQDSLMSFSSSYSHSKPPMNPSSSSFLKHTTKLKTPPSFHHSSPSNELFPAAQNIESIMSTGTGTGGSGDGGGKSGGSGVSLTTTTNSLISGSLFDHRDSKQTLNSTTTTTSTKNRSPHKATITTTHHGSPPSIPGVITQEKFHKSSDTVQSLNDYNADVIQKNQKDGQFSSSRLSRRGVACAGFPAFSWCGGLQRVTGGCASLGRGHHSLQGSSKNSSRQKLPGSAEQQQTAFRSHELTSTIGARPTPPPKPGPFVVEVILTRGTRSGLGFSITGGVGNEASNGDSGIFVTKITSGGVAETDGRIRIGDRIVQVNDIPLVDVTHEQAVRVLKQAGDQVKLVIVKQVSHSSRHLSSTGETKIPSNDMNNQGVLPPNPDFNGSGDFRRNDIADEYCVKSSTPASLSSFHRSPSLSPTPSSHSASPALEASVHTAPSRKSSSGQIVRGGDSREQQQQQEEEENLQQQATGTSKSLQSKHRHSLNYNHQSQLHSNDLSKTAKKNSYTSSMANNENYRSSPDLSNDRLHKPAFYGSTGTNIPCFASTGQELLENRMVGIIDYAAAASVSNLLSEWPDARLVTLYRSGRKRVSSIHRDKGDLNDTFRRGLSSGGVGSLGLNIVGGDGSEATFISHIQPDKPAGQSKRIFVGDRLLTVNGVDVTRFGHEKAAAALRDARDRVDLLLVYRPEEYAEFEKHFCRQLKAVGHKLSYKCLHSLRAENNNNDDDNDGIEKDGGVRADESPRKSNDASKDKAKRKTTDEPSDKTKQSHQQQQQQQQQKRQVKKKSKASKKQLGEEEAVTKGQTDDMVTYPNVLLLRCQVDYDPVKENHHQTIPKKVFSLRSGDLVYVINTVDSEWWQAQKFDPATNEPVGPIGLIPSRLRLERKERTRTLHVNFMARNSRSMDSPSVKSNDAYERRKIKSIKPSTSSYSLVEGVSHLKNAKIFKERTEDRDASHSSKGCRDSSRRRYHHRRRSSDQRHRPLSYIAVTPVHLSFARPVVILGYMKDRIADELLCEFPDLFGTAVPYTTRQRRPNEVEGRDYHFVISKEIMVADIAAQKYLEAGEYNGNLYGTHLDSVFEVSELGLHCLLDVGGPALKRLESAGLPPIAILVLPETLSPTDKNDVHDDVGDNGGNDNNHNNNEQSPNANEQGKNNKSKLQKRTSVESEALKNLQVKLGRLLQHFTSFLTAIVTTDDYNVAYNRVKEIIFNNAGPIVWLNSPQPIP